MCPLGKLLLMTGVQASAGTFTRRTGRDDVRYRLRGRVLEWSEKSLR